MLRDALRAEHSAVEGRVVVDQDAFNQGVFKAQGGRFERLNQTFDGRLEKILV
jgi:hypothetical protein